MAELRFDDIYNVKFKENGKDHNEQIYIIEMKNKEIIYVTALINKDFDVVVKCDSALSEELEDYIYMEALKVWRNQLNETV